MGPWAGVSMVRRSWLLVILLAVLAMVASLVVSPAAAGAPRNKWQARGVGASRSPGRGTLGTGFAALHTCPAGACC